MTMSKPAAIIGVSAPVDSRKRHPDLRKLPSWWTRKLLRLDGRHCLGTDDRPLRRRAEGTLACARSAIGCTPRRRKPACWHRPSRRAAGSTTTAWSSGKPPGSRSEDRSRRSSSCAGSSFVKATNPYAAGVHSHILQVAVTDLDRAFGGFFRRVKAGKTPGYPRFKGRDRFDSFGLKEYGNGWKNRRPALEAVRDRPRRRALASSTRRRAEDHQDRPVRRRLVRQHRLRDADPPAATDQRNALVWMSGFHSAGHDLRDGEHIAHPRLVPR